jgi:Transglycosylase SLT domain/LysM domain
MMRKKTATMIITNIPRGLRAALMTGAALLVCGASSAHLKAQALSDAPAASSVAPRVANASHRRTATGRSRYGNHRQIKIRVRAGDTLSMIAGRFGFSIVDVARVNGLSVHDTLRPGGEIILPAPSTVSASASVETPVIAANHHSRDGRSRLSLVDGSTVEADDVWEDEQGVRYRRGGVTYLLERARVSSIERGTRPDQTASAATKEEKQVARLVEVNATGSERTIQPIWIHLVGGARVEADDVTETPAGVWYRRDTLSIYLDRSRIERIEREAETQVTAKDATPARPWKERGWSTGSAKIDALIRQNGARYNVDPYLIFCVMEQESHFNAHVVSPKGARGLMQLMPGTGARFGVRRPFDPAENIMGGTRYLKQLLGQFGGRVDLVLAGYNAGEGAVMKYGGRVPPYRETRDYVKRISKRYGQNKPPAAESVKSSNSVAQASRLR